jgi:anthranilate phosphoribosyltransferase
MDKLLAHLRAKRDLTPEQIEQAIASLIAEGSLELKADFLQALREKGETADEIAAFVRTLLRHAVDPQIDAAALPGPMIDICGTGGDRMELFNISTTSMFILVAGGAVVVKHGNRAITSSCGGADVLEELGVRIDLAPAELRRCVEQLGLGFIFAPAYHPAFKAIAPVRKQLAERGIPTIFNMLGPLLNPARPAFQLIGIFSPALLPKYAAALAALGRTRAWAVHGDGTDELATTGASEVHEVSGSAIRSFTIYPSALGLPTARLEDLRGGDKAANAAMLVAVLDGSDTGARRDIVLLNAAAGFVISGLAADLSDGLQLAREQVTSGRALARLHALQRFSTPLPAR